MQANQGKSLIKLSVLLVATMCAALTGCSSSPKVLPASPHAATTSDKVELYQKQPKKYEQLGTLRLEVTPEMKWDEAGNTNTAFAILRQRAASLGANGLLLWAEPGMSDTTVSAGYHGKFYRVPVKQTRPNRTAIAQAMYVINK